MDRTIEQKTVDALIGLNYQLPSIIAQLEQLIRGYIICGAPKERIKSLNKAVKILYANEEYMHQQCWEVFSSKYQRIDGKEI